MRYNLRENKSEKLKDFFKTTFSHFMFPIYHLIRF